MKKLLDINTWNRKDHYHFFKQFDDPFWGITITIDCSIAHKKTKTNGHSFFLYYLYQSLKAANSIVNFRYRIIGDDVYEYETVDAGPTILRADGTFGFSHITYHENFNEYLFLANLEMEKVQNSTSLFSSESGENIIHYSSLPWLNFTAMQHARSFSFKDSSPKISFGKMTVNKDNNLSMPVSIHVHHALVDGWHVAQFADAFQNLMNAE